LTVLLFIFLISSYGTLLGVPNAVAKFVSEGLGKESPSFSAGALHSAKRILYFSTIPTMIVLIALSYYFSVWLFHNPSYKWAIALTFFAVILSNIISYYNFKFLGLGAFSSSAVVFIASTLFQRICALVVAYPFRLGTSNQAPDSGSTALTAIMGGWVLGSAIALLVSVAINSKHKLHSKPSNDVTSSMVLRFSCPIWGYTLIAALQSWVDIFVLYALGTDFATVGIYYLIANGATFLSVIWVGLSSAILPSMSATLARKDNSTFGMLFQKSSRLLNVVVIPVALAVAALAPSALKLAYGPGYVKGDEAFALLVIASVIPGYVALFVSTFQAMNDTVSVLKMGITAIIVDVATLLVIVPSIGTTTTSLVLMSAASARVVAYATSFGIGLFSLRSLVRSHIDVTFFRSVFLGVLIAIPAGMIDWGQISVGTTYSKLAMDVFIIVVFGVGLSRLFRLFEKSDFDLLKTALPSFLSGLLSSLERLLVVNHRKILTISAEAEVQQKEQAHPSSGSEASSSTQKS
jgi:O-antigen/teichoic acid export membrane protein